MNTNLFGTDGIRNRVGQEPFTLTHLPRLGAAIALWAHTKYTSDLMLSSGSTNLVGLVACDTRISSSFVKTALISGMLAHNITVVDAGVLPTPAVFALLKNQQIYQFGIMITASHNAYHDNGIKLIDAHDGKLTEHDEQTITSFFYHPQSESLSISESHPLSQPKYTNFGALYTKDILAQQYYDYIIQRCTPRFLDGITVVLDCAHGATSYLAPALFTHLGAQVITINNTPNGTNINDQCGAVYPEQLQKTVLRYNADMGCAFDGDGDRITIVNRHGDIKDGDDILALLAMHPDYAHQKTIVGTIMSNKGLEIHLQSENKQFIRTSVGDKHVSAYLKQHKLLLGGEPSGHIIMGDYLPTGDGIYTALRVLEAAIATHNRDFITFTKYHQTLINIPVLVKKSLHFQPYADIISHYTKQLLNGRLEVRYSGTENVLRVMVESKDHTHALSIGNQLAHELNEHLSAV